MRRGQTWLLVVPMPPNLEDCLRLCLLWELFLLCLEFPRTSCMVFRVMNQDCDHKSHPCVSSEWELEMLYYFKGKILSSPPLFWISVHLEVSGYTLVSVCLKTFTPIAHVLGKWGETPTTEIVMLTHLLWPSRITSPWKSVIWLSLEEIVCLHLKLSVKTT